MKKTLLLLTLMLSTTSIVNADDLTLEEQLALEQEKVINEAEYYTSEIDLTKEVLFQCLDEKMKPERSAKLKAQLTSKTLVTQLNGILKTARKTYCENNKEKLAQKYVKKNSEDAYRKALWGTDFTTYKQCANKVSQEIYNENPCNY